MVARAGEVDYDVTFLFVSMSGGDDHPGVIRLAKGFLLAARIGS